MLKNLNFRHIAIVAVLFCCLLLLVASCKSENDDDDNNNNEQELITTLRLTFVNTIDSNDMRMFEFNDPDGDGGLSPTADTIVLAANQSYSMTANFLDESKAPAVDLTEEIREEGVEHQVFYTVTDASTTFAYSDTDGNMLPLGLNMTVSGGNINTGTLTITLKHQPDGTKNNNINVGDTDVEAIFVLKIN